MKVPRWCPAALSAITLLSLSVTGCGSTPTHPVASPSASPSAALPGLLGLAGETALPLAIAGPYYVEDNVGTEPREVDSATVPDTAMAAVTALAQDLGVPGAPISTANGLGYNLGATSGYQLTTNPTLTSFNFHPNTPTDEVGTTPTVAGADQFAESFLSGDHVPTDGGLIPLPQLSFTNGSDRTVYFQWSLNGLPVVNILGQPEEIYVDVATDQHQVTQLVGITGAVPYGVIGNPVAYPTMTLPQVLKYLNSGVIEPDRYLLSPSGLPFPAVSPAPSGPSTISSESRGVVDSYGTAVPVDIFRVSGNPNVTQFVTCAAPPDGCVPLRFESASPSPSPSPSG
ncbi:MAG TPA: hypothetical protein VMW80_08210 [Candidatus Dormibacteraeota bacterium]|nr:hypothetical protein [Candidatus Dormibacteraeota bacterium]